MFSSGISKGIADPSARQNVISTYHLDVMDTYILSRESPLSRKKIILVRKNFFKIFFLDFFLDFF